MMQKKLTHVTVEPVKKLTHTYIVYIAKKKLTRSKKPVKKLTNSTVKTR